MVDYSQYKGQPFQVISKLQVRYTGIFQEIDQETQTLCLSEVFNHGTEDRPSSRHLEGSSVSLGWVRFHTNSIESLALIENYVPPSQQPVDPILASVRLTFQSAQPHNSNRAAGQGLASLPPKPTASASSANTALDRVQKSLTALNDAGRQRKKAQPPAVPDAEFDFSKGTERFQKERLAHKEQKQNQNASAEEGEPRDIGEPENQPHPSAVVDLPSSPQETQPKPSRTTPAYSKSSFFDNISSDTSRVSRAEERYRNLDTFGEAGGTDPANGARYGQHGGNSQRGMSYGHGRSRGRGRRGGFHPQQFPSTYEQQ